MISLSFRIIVWSTFFTNCLEFDSKLDQHFTKEVHENSAVILEVDNRTGDGLHGYQYDALQCRRWQEDRGWVSLATNMLLRRRAIERKTKLYGYIQIDNKYTACMKQRSKHVVCPALLGAEPTRTSFCSSGFRRSCKLPSRVPLLFQTWFENHFERPMSCGQARAAASTR